MPNHGISLRGQSLCTMMMCCLNERAGNDARGLASMRRCSVDIRATLGEAATAMADGAFYGLSRFNDVPLLPDDTQGRRRRREHAGEKQCSSEWGHSQQPRSQRRRLASGETEKCFERIWRGSPAYSSGLASPHKVESFRLTKVPFDAASSKPAQSRRAPGLPASAGCHIPLYGSRSSYGHDAHAVVHMTSGTRRSTGNSSSFIFSPDAGLTSR